MSNSGGENDFVTKESFNQVLQMMEEQKRMMEEQAQLNALMFKQMSDLMIQKPTKSKSKSKTQAPIRIIKTDKTASSSDDDASVSSSVSDKSNKSDVQFISHITRQRLTNDDAAIKQTFDQLNKIREKRLKAIPMLKFTEENTDSFDGAQTHNYVKWLQNLLKFFATLSPQLANATKEFLASLDVDNYLTNSGKIQYPTLDEEDYPNLMKITAMDAISQTVSEDFIHLVDSETLTDIFPSLVNIHFCCAPNSSEDRTDALGRFWSLTMTKADRTIFRFSARLKKTSITINEQFGSTVVTQEMLVSALKIGVLKGEVSKGYTEALKSLRFNIASKNKYDFHMIVNLLHNLRDKTYDVVKHPQVIENDTTQTQDHSASMAKTRGGLTRGGGGKGRGGKGAGRGGKGGKGRNRERNYYFNTSPTGEDVVTKEVTPKTGVNSPCFKQIKYGECNNNDCPFNHDFEVVDRRRKQKQRSTESKYDQDSSSSSSSSSANTSPNTSVPQKTGNVSSKISSSVCDQPTSSDDDEDGYDFYNDRGFYFKSSACSTQAQTESSSSSLMDWWFLYPFLLAQIFLSKVVSSVKFLLPYLVLFLMVPKILLQQVMFRNRDYSCSAVAPFLCALYQIILDCGCTTTMSGDEGLFLPGSLVKIDESVSMAESGLSAKATHYGKICLNGHLIDALFVPQFKQTMISLGQLERLGLKYKEVNNFRDLITPSGSIFLSFTLTNNNLYELNNRNLARTNSSSSATSADRATKA
jgi:hypothetical protein